MNTSIPREAKLALKEKQRGEWGVWFCDDGYLVGESSGL